MSVIGYVSGGIDKGESLVKATARNRVFQVASAAVLAGVLVSPLFTPLAVGMAYAVAVAASAVALGYPTAMLARDGLKKLGVSLMPGSPGSSVGSSSTRSLAKNVKDGQATGNILVDALVDKLRKSGMKVSTDWTDAEKILKGLPEKYDHLKKNKDTLGGFVYQGVIFLNPKNVDESVPVHEYTHVWAEALRQKNPREWEHIVSLLKKETQLWQDVKTAYPHLQTDDEIADEVLATYSGNHGKERLNQYYQEGKSPKGAFEELRQALKLFWENVSKFFKCHFEDVDSIADRVLYDFVSGVDPGRHVDSNTFTLSDQKPLAAVKKGNKRSYKPAAQSEGASQTAGGSNTPLKNYAVQRFAEMLITRMEEMEKSEWKKGWIDSTTFTGFPRNITGSTLNGSNAFFLLLHTSMNGFSMPVYMTMNQADELGLRVNKGSKSIPVIYWSPYYKEKSSEVAPGSKPKTISAGEFDGLPKAEQDRYDRQFVLKSYSEFNVDQTNLKEVKPELYKKLQNMFKAPEVRDDKGMYVNPALDRMLEKQEWLCPVQYDKMEAGAYYSPGRDIVVVPMKSQFNISDTPDEVFKDGMEYYSSLLHEMAHSTGTKDRLNREMGGLFGDSKYGKEELVAEMTAATVGSTLGFSKRIYENNAAYLKGWVSSIKQEPKFLLNVISEVGKASNLILDKVNTQKLALGEEQIVDRGEIITDDEKSDLKSTSIEKGIVAFLVRIANDPSVDADFTKRQAYLVKKHFEGFETKEEKQQEADRLWAIAEKDPEMRGLSGMWIEQAKQALQNIVDGVQEEKSRGMHV